MTAKREHGGYLVWVTSLATGAAFADVTVTAYSYSNQRLAQGKTESETHATFGQAT